MEVLRGGIQRADRHFQRGSPYPPQNVDRSGNWDWLLLESEGLWSDFVAGNAV